MARRVKGRMPKIILSGAPFSKLMVGVAQLVEPRIVIPDVAGSSPVTHPSIIKHLQKCWCFFLSKIYHWVTLGMGLNDLMGLSGGFSGRRRLL